MPGICDPCLGKKRALSQTRQADVPPPLNIPAQRLSKDIQREFNSVSPKIVIIGAGAAGLACAQRLADCSFTNIMILEAQNYIGGRICSVAIDDGFIEKGAQFLHGENNLTNMMNQSILIDAAANATSGPPRTSGSAPATGTAVQQQQPNAQQNSIHIAAKEHSDFVGVFLLDDDSQVQEQSPEIIAQVRSETQQEINKMVERCKEAAGTMTSENVGESRQSSFGHYLRTEFDKFMQSHDDEAPALKNYRWAVYDWMTRVHISDNSCRSLYELSLSEYAKYAGSLECTPLRVPMLEALKLCAPFALADKAPVMLSKPVKQLRFDPSSASPVVISCDDGQLFVADHCILTASLGFLKKNQETFFIPQLPTEKVKAITDSGFGTVNKIFLTFSEAWWKQAYGDAGGFQFLYMNDPRGSQQKAWHRSIIGFDVCTSVANTLVAWVAGSDQSEALEKMGENEIGTDCQNLLQNFMRGVVVPMPSRVIRTTWANNPYTLGSYSNAAINQGENINIIGQPTWFYRKATNTASTGTSTDPDVMVARKSMDGYQLPGLLFAGEATHPSWFSTVPGAMESGKREADRLIELYKPLIEHVQRKSVSMQDKRTSVQSQGTERMSVGGPNPGERGSVTQQGQNSGAPGERKSLQPGEKGGDKGPQRSQSQNAANKRSPSQEGGNSNEPTKQGSVTQKGSKNEAPPN